MERPSRAPSRARRLPRHIVRMHRSSKGTFAALIWPLQACNMTSSKFVDLTYLAIVGHVSIIKL